MLFCVQHHVGETVVVSMTCIPKHIEIAYSANDEHGVSHGLVCWLPLFDKFDDRAVDTVILVKVLEVLRFINKNESCGTNCQLLIFSCLRSTCCGLLLMFRYCFQSAIETVTRHGPSSTST